MSREIKFRVYDTFRKQMVTVGVDSNASFNHDGTISTHGILGECPLMRFTGLKDMNGIDIYESDILQPKDGHFENGEIDRSVVYWDDKLARFGLKFHSCFGGEGYTGRGQHIDQWIEDNIVIGNIHKNPELL